MLHSAWAEEPADHPKIGLVLSGGGARGGAHVGVLKALEELGVKVDYIAGTSMGAIIGGLYASGYTADEIEMILNETDWKTALTDAPARRDRTMRKKELEAEFLIPYRLGFNNRKIQLPLGAIEGQHLDQIFQELFIPVIGVDDFDRLPIPFRAVATDLVTGEAVVLSDGSLPDAVRASMSVPAVFAPVTINGRLLVDGGMANNLPVDVVREMGADIVIAVDISSPLLTEEQLTSVLSVTEQLTNFLTRKTADEQIASLGPEDILIVPELGGFRSSDFEGAGSIIPLGYDATKLKKDQLANLAGLTSQETVVLDKIDASVYIVEFVELENGSVLNDALIESRLDVELGQPLDKEALNKSMDRIYGLDVFESVTYSMVKNTLGQQGVFVNAIPRNWGPNYLQFGLELASDFSQDSTFTLGAAYTRNALNSLGGELRVVASLGRLDELSFDFYQPIDSRASWFVEPEVYWRRQNYNLWLENTNIAEFEISGAGVNFGFGRNLSTTDRLTLSYEYGRGVANIITGELWFPIDDKVRIGELDLSYLHDSMDNPWFPTSGMRHRLDYRYATRGLGSLDDFQQAIAIGSFAFSHDRNTFLLNYEGGYSFDDRSPVERWFQLGGLGRLSGLVPNQLTGRNIVLSTLAYYRRLNEMDLLKTYAGFTLEAGNVWDRNQDISFGDLRYSASVFVGADTPIGPVYFAYGRNDDGGNAVYFYVGNPFTSNRFD
ncbi:patatin-like phospholipase family protein [Pseudomonadota bacterium]